MAIPPFGLGAPLSFGGQDVARLGDADNVTLAAGASVTGTPTAARAYTLPALSSTGTGAKITVQNLGSANITITGDGTDQVDDAGAPGSFVLTPGQTVVLEAKVAAGGTSGSWFATDAVPGGVLLGTQMFLAGGTYTPSAGCVRALVVMSGGGGGGGGAGSSANATGGDGGGGGASATFELDIVAGVTGTVVIGAGGAGGVAALAGAGGVSTTLAYNGTTSTAQGGGGGATNSPAGAAFFGASRAGGIFNLSGRTGYGQRGESGDPAVFLSAVICLGGQGGNSAQGPGALSRTLNASGGTDGFDAEVNTGGGGGGAVQNNSGAHNGGDGGTGIMAIYEYR